MQAKQIPDKMYDRIIKELNWLKADLNNEGDIEMT